MLNPYYWMLDLYTLYSIRMLDSYNRMLTLLSPITPNIRMLDNLIRMLSSYSRMLDFQMPDALSLLLQSDARSLNIWMLYPY